MTQNHPDAVRLKTPIRAAFEAFAVIIGLVAFAVMVMVDSSFQQFAVIVSFVAGFFLAKALFEQLGGVSGARPGAFPKLANGVATFAAGISVSFAFDWFFEYSHRIGVGVAMALGIVFAYLAIAWRQRMLERRVYRATLDTMSI